MKKTLLALAVLAASGASFAQSSVTLYGRVDANLTKLTDKSVAMTDGSDYGPGASRLGVKGVEDLGGGLSAGFLVEAGFKADANTGATTLGSRNSYVELNGKFGGFRLGRQLNPALYHVGTYSAFGTDYGMASGSQVLNIEGARYNNSISYFTPAMNGFTAQFITAMKETDTYSVAGVNNTGSAVDTKSVVGAPVGAVGATKNPISARVNYAVGPVSAGLALTKNGRSGDKLLTQVGASYDFGAAKLLVAFEQDSNNATSKNAYSVGVTAPVGAATLRATYGKDVQTTKQQLGFGADYALSKRTALYGIFAQTKLTGATAVRQITFGVGHNF
jgi:predicted porin